MGKPVSATEWALLALLIALPLCLAVLPRSWRVWRCR
jgi:hypothetical protein